MVQFNSKFTTAVIIVLYDKRALFKKDLSTTLMDILVYER